MKKQKTMMTKMMEYKTPIFITVICVLVAVLIYLTFSAKTIPLDVNVSFSILPGNYTSVVLIGAYAEANITKIDDLLYWAAEQDVPITLFINARQYNNGPVAAYLNEEADIDLDIEEIKQIAADYGTKLDIEPAGYIEIPYTKVTYQEQEQLIRQSKQAFKKHNLTANGIMPPYLSYDYNTLLAVENNNLDFIAVMAADKKPFHPESVLGGPMNILVLPLTEKIDTNFMYSFIIFDLATMSFAQSSILKAKTAWFTTAVQLNSQIRQTEKMSADIVTNYKDWRTSIQIIGLKNDTKIEFKTQLNPKSINSTDHLMQYTNTSGGFFVVANEKEKNILIQWEKIK